MSVNLISAEEFKAAADQHAVEHRAVKKQQVLERVNKELNARVVAFRNNKGLNDIGMLVNVQYMYHEKCVINDVVAEIEKAGYKVRLTESEVRDEDTYWLNIAVS